ncbi:MAG: 16S rRNA (guanine(527)-N(7))-methyltransferase RsmG [Betaproteobacteria bacterium]|jgi:16S rRNA (guanine527-N7)-methyltransferase|nr:16S rRNA (guanine(527)-N(7))-methyltransferase RsmG [Betaproteobacteria bacterium]
MSPAQQLAEGLQSLGLAVSLPTQQRLLAYLELIAKWNRIHNLTAIRDIPTMVSAHLLDSLSVATRLTAQTVLDIGSGAGLPGIPLALIWPQSQVTVLDSNNKKTAFLQQAKIELGLDNLSVVCARSETWDPGHQFDLVISRAYSELAEFVKVATRLCKSGGVLAAMKGQKPDDEIAKLPAADKVRSIIALNVPGLNAERHLVLMEP